MWCGFPTTRRLGAALLLGGLVALGAPGTASAQAPAEQPKPPSYKGEYCEATCGKFKQDTCEIWDASGAPSCSCVTGEDAGSHTRCACSDGREPQRCQCSNTPYEACDPDDPADDCKSCQCQC
jgi:hypothetical protein